MRTHGHKGAFASRPEGSGESKGARMPDPASQTKIQPHVKPTSGTVGNLRVFGVPIRLHFTFLLLLVFLVFIGIGGKQSGVTTAVYILALFASVLLHEIGHAL